MLSSCSVNRESYRKGGEKGTNQRTTCHLELLMVVFLRGLGGGYQFDLATEMEDAGKYEDIVFRYDINGKRTYRLIHVKHKAESSSSKITLSDLLSTSNKADYGVLTCFNSFREVKREFLKGDGELRDVMIYTNGEFKWGDKQQEFKMEGLFVNRRNEIGQIEVDDLLQTELLYFTEDVEVRRKWMDFLKENVTEDKEKVEEDALLYFDKFVFAINQPDEKDLTSVITQELKGKYKITDPNEAYSLFRDLMRKWMTSPEGYYLNHNECQNFVQHLTKKYEAISFGLRPPTINFTGREKELRELKEAHLNGTATVVVTGLGGIGKTQLVNKFIADNSDCFDSVAWMNGESREDLMHSFRRLAVDKLGVKELVADGKPKGLKSILEEVYQFFQYRKCIIVFDNVSYSGEQESEEDYVLEFSPKSTPKPFLIMTSRYQSWKSSKVMNLMEFKDDEAIDLIKTSLGHEMASDKKEVIALARELHNYPLALQQSLAYIKRTATRAGNFGGKRGISHYLDLYEKNCKTLLDEKGETFNGDRYEKATSYAWDITLEDIRKREDGILAERILKFTSYLPPDSIDRKEINKCFQSEDEETIKSSLILLNDYSMVTMENDTITIHRLVQKITRMKAREMGEERVILEMALKVSEELELQNSVTLWEYAMGYEDLVKENLHLPKSILKAFKDKNRYEEGRLFGHKFIPEMKVMFGTTEGVVFEAIFLLADVTYMDGKYHEAFELFQEVFNFQMNNLGLEHPDTLTSMGNMAIVLDKLGSYGDSLKMNQCVYETRKRVLGVDNPDTLTSMSSMASVFWSLGRIDECLRLNVEVFEKRKTVLGDEHPETLDSMHNTASVLGSLGRYEECLKLNMEVYEKKKLVLGEEHPETLATLSNIGSALKFLRRQQECLNITEEVHRKYKKVLGENHPDTLVSMNNLASVLRNLGDLEECLRVTRELYEKRKEVLGVDHPDTLATMSNVALTLQALERYEECLECSREAYDRRRRALGDEHPDTLKSMNNLASVLKRLGRLQECLKFTNDVFEISVRVLGGRHPSTLNRMNNLAAVLESLGRYEESLKVSQVVCEKRKNILGHDHPDTLNSVGTMASVLESLGRYEESAKLRQALCGKWKRILGHDHPETLSAVSNLAFVLHKLRRHKESLELYQEVYEKRRRDLGEKHPSTLLSKSSLDMLLNDMNNSKCSLT